MTDDVRLDWQRKPRTGLPEVVFAQDKSVEQLITISEIAQEKNQRILMTRVDENKAKSLLSRFAGDVSWHELSKTLTVNVENLSKEPMGTAAVGIVAAGTSDSALVAEIEQCLHFFGVPSQRYMDVGVAGLWRLTSIADELVKYPVLIAVAGMEGALFSVLAGLVQSPVIAVPSSVGYGVTAGGYAALNSALGSCAPGIAVVNIDNGFGAAALATKILATQSI